MEGLSERMLAELAAAEVTRDRPLVAVDADEVLVHFAEDFAAWCAAEGFRFQLTQYRLDSALTDSRGAPLPREEIERLIWSFIDGETHRQREIEGAAAALARLAEAAQVVILTNVPVRARAARVENLASHGMNYPVVVNEGGKGRALAWLHARAAAPAAFVDDSPAQLASAAKHAPEVHRLHLVGSALVRPVIPPVADAHHNAEDWREAERLIRAALTL